MISMNRFAIAFLFFLMAGPALADTKTEITTVLNYFAEIWNEGDLDAIRGYYHHDFVLVTDSGPSASGQRLSHLKDTARAGEDRGVLAYSHVMVNELGDKHATAYGELSLKFKDGSAINSWFTTVYAKTPFGWKAILTHN
jgi:ketosteroid isomerase-like protein